MKQLTGSALFNLRTHFVDQLRNLAEEIVAVEYDTRNDLWLILHDILNEDVWKVSGDLPVRQFLGESKSFTSSTQWFDYYAGTGCGCSPFGIISIEPVDGSPVLPVFVTHGKAVSHPAVRSLMGLPPIGKS